MAVDVEDSLDWNVSSHVPAAGARGCLPKSTRPRQNIAPHRPISARRRRPEPLFAANHHRKRIVTDVKKKALPHFPIPENHGNLLSSHGVSQNSVGRPPAAQCRAPADRAGLGAPPLWKLCQLARRRRSCDARRRQPARLRRPRRQGDLHIHSGPQARAGRHRRGPRGRHHLRCSYRTPGTDSPHLQGDQARHTVRRFQGRALANGLGHSAQGTPMGEPADRMAVFGRLHAGNTHQLQVQGGRHPFRREAGLRVLCPGTQLAQVHTKGIRKQLPLHARQVEARPDKVRH